MITINCLPIWSQQVVIEEVFDNNNLEWRENVNPENGESVIMDGEFKFDSKNSSTFYSDKTKTPSLLYADGIMPINPMSGFEISFDMKFDHIIGPLYKLNGPNLSSGVLLEFDDEYNFIAVAANEKACYILQYKDGLLNRYKAVSVKMKVDGKDKVNANLKIIYKDYKLKVFIDDIEMAEFRKVNIESPTIALFVTGKRKVSFDNLIISQ